MKHAHVETDGSYYKLVNSATGVAEMTAFDGERSAAWWGVGRGFTVEGFEHLMLFIAPNGQRELIDAKRALQDAHDSEPKINRAGVIALHALVGVLIA